MDEATSALDSESENKVKKAISALSSGRTVISVAHRLSTISDFDKIVVLDNGKIIEVGTHKDLLNNKKLYYKYYKLQEMSND